MGYTTQKRLGRWGKIINNPRSTPPKTDSLRQRQLFRLYSVRVDNLGRDCRPSSCRKRTRISQSWEFSPTRPYRYHFLCKIHTAYYSYCCAFLLLRCRPLVRFVEEKSATMGYSNPRCFHQASLPWRYFSNQAIMASCHSLRVL